MKNDRAPRCRDEFRRRLAHRIDIVAAERVVFAVGEFPFPILVALVAGDDDDRTAQFGPPYGFQQIGRADDIGVERLERFGVTAPHNRLRRQVENDFRLNLPERGVQRPRKFRISHSISPAKALAWMTSCRFGWVGGGRLTPQTLAPSFLSQSEIQPPLKPVWPVTRTRRP